jgi:hypothetical protein
MNVTIAFIAFLFSMSQAFGSFELTKCGTYRLRGKIISYANPSSLALSIFDNSKSELILEIEGEKDYGHLSYLGYWVEVHASLLKLPINHRGSVKIRTIQLASPPSLLDTPQKEYDILEAQKCQSE